MRPGNRMHSRADNQTAGLPGSPCSVVKKARTIIQLHRRADKVAPPQQTRSSDFHDGGASEDETIGAVCRIIRIRNRLGRATPRAREIRRFRQRQGGQWLESHLIQGESNDLLPCDAMQGPGRDKDLPLLPDAGRDGRTISNRLDQTCTGGGFICAERGGHQSTAATVFQPTAATGGERQLVGLRVGGNARKQGIHSIRSCPCGQTFPVGGCDRQPGCLKGCGGGNIGHRCKTDLINPEGSLIIGAGIGNQPP